MCETVVTLSVFQVEIAEKSEIPEAWNAYSKLLTFAVFQEETPSGTADEV